MTTRNKNVPALRFPEFKGDWETKKFEDFAPLQRGFDITEKEQKPGNVPVISSGGISSYHNEFKVKAPGIVVGRKGTLGKVFYTADNFWAHDTTLWVTSFKGNHPRFVYYFFIIFKLERFGTGGNVPSLNRNNVHNQNVVIPNYVEQEKIAAFLTAVDEKIQLLTKKKDLLEQYKKGVMQKIFNQEIRFKDDNGNDFADWEEKKVEDVFAVTRGNVLAMSKVSLEKNETFLYPVYSSQTRNNGLSGYYTEYLFEDCITWTTDGAGAGDVNFRKGKFYCTNVCGVLKSNEGYANNFMSELLNTISRKHVSYVGNPKLMNNVMSKIKIFIPKSIMEQRKIADFFCAIDNKINLVNQQLERTKEYKKGLLQQMFV